MGIRGLTKFLREEASAAVKSHDPSYYQSRVIAIDASVCIYQFLSAIRGPDGEPLTSEDGKITSHIVGLLSRTINFLNYGIRPVYVFDGKPPEEKAGELDKRREARSAAEAAAQEAKEAGDMEAAQRFEKRNIRVSQEQVDECRHLLRCMGIPFVDAPCEAESQCVELAKAGKVYAVASEDGDTITHQAPIFVRGLTVSLKKLKAEGVTEVEYRRVLHELDLSQEQFTDLCILMKCDYTGTIKGIGPKTAYKLVKEHGSIEGILEYIQNNDTRYTAPPQAEFDFAKARKMFNEAEVTPASEINIVFRRPNVAALTKFLKARSFNQERIDRLVASLGAAKKASGQRRLDSFFKVKKAALPPRTPKVKSSPGRPTPTKGKAAVKKPVSSPIRSKTVGSSARSPLRRNSAASPVIRPPVKQMASIVPPVPKPGFMEVDEF